MTSLFYMMVFFLRRYIVIFVLTILPLSTFTQILTQMTSTMIVIGYIARVHPYERSIFNKMELFNEITVLIASYPLLVFTPWVWDQKPRLDVGWFLVACILINCIVNVSVMIYIGIKETCLKLRYK